MTIEQVGIGAAPGDNSGDGLRTAMTKVNNNFSNSSHAASKLVGTATGEVPTADDLGVVGETNWNGGNMNVLSWNGSNVPKLMKNISGGAISGLASVPGSSLQFAGGSNLGVIVGFGSPTGTWKSNITENTGNNEFAEFVRIS